MVERAKEDERWLFDAELRPHRSLGPRGFLWLMAGLCTLSFAAGLAFFLVGAWPVVGFLGLDVLLVYLAFRASFRSAALRENLRIGREEIELERITPAGRRAKIRLPTAWLKIKLEEKENGPGEIRLLSRGRSIAFARFLTPEERQQLVREMRAALQPASFGP